MILVSFGIKWIIRQQARAMGRGQDKVPAGGHQDCQQWGLPEAVRSAFRGEEEEHGPAETRLGFG